LEKINHAGKGFMLDNQLLKNNLSFVSEKLSTRGFKLDIEKYKFLDNERKKFLEEIESLRSLRNKVSKEIPILKKKGIDVSEKISEMKKVGEKIKLLEKDLEKIEEELKFFLLSIPNIPDDSTPIGRDESENVEIRKWGTPRKFNFTPLDHVELGKVNDILDFERASKITGSKFALYKGYGALLERALINFMLDIHTREHGYKEVLPPFMVNAQSLYGTGNLPKFEEDLFKIKDFPYYLIPTAEVPVTNIHRKETLKEEDLPIKYVAYTPCFRSEAGSWGKETRGLIRQHQFNKVELLKFVKPEDSMEELEKLTNDAEKILQLLGLPYRVVSLCTGDLGFSSSKTYDIEVWMPGRNKYVEISSCSNFKDFQARRSSIKYKPKEGGKAKFLHTLNGSGLAIGRTWVAIVENFQNEDGSITIPEVLIPYMNGIKRINPKS